VPHIIVTADRPGGRGEGAVTLCERISHTDFESHHFANQLIERLGWAVADAHEHEADGAAVRPGHDRETSHSSGRPSARSAVPGHQGFEVAPTGAPG
jgi:hypothetical protein